MPVEKKGSLTVVRYLTDPLISVYRDSVYIGAIYPPIKGVHDNFISVKNADLVEIFRETEEAALAVFR